MLSKEVAVKLSAILRPEVEQELILMFDDLIQQQVNLMKENAPDEVLRIAAVKLDLCQRLKQYRKYIEAVVKNGRYDQ